MTKPLRGKRRKAMFDALLKPRPKGGDANARQRNKAAARLQAATGGRRIRGRQAESRGLAEDILALARDLMRLARGFDADHYIHGQAELVRSVARRIRAVVRRGGKR